MNIKIRIKKRRRSFTMSCRPRNLHVCVFGVFDHNFSRKGYYIYTLIKKQFETSEKKNLDPNLG